MEALPNFIGIGNGIGVGIGVGQWKCTITIDAMLKFDGGVDTNADVKCEQSIVLLHWRIQGGAPGTQAPPGSKFFHFHAVFGKNVKNNSNFGSWRPPPWGKSWIRHCIRWHFSNNN